MGNWWSGNDESDKKKPELPPLARGSKIEKKKTEPTPPSAQKIRLALASGNEVASTSSVVPGPVQVGETSTSQPRPGPVGEPSSAQPGPVAGGGEPDSEAESRENSEPRASMQ